MRSVKGAKVFGALLFFAFAAAFAAWFVTATSERERYLTSRNFRLLAMIASQLDTLIETQGRTFQTLLTATDTSTTKDEPDWVKGSVDYVPSLRALDRDRELPPRFTPQTSAKSTDYRRTTGAVIDQRGSWLRLSITRESEARDVHLGIRPLLAPLFASKLREGAFDTLLLVAADGKVLHAEGARSAELAHGRLDALGTPRPMLQWLGQSSEPASSPGFSSVARTNGTVTVIVSGNEYKMFTQPCCSAARLDADNAPGLVVVGLIDASVLRSKARQIPTTVVFVFSALILLALAGWPFLRMRLLGERQRIRRIEVVQVITSGLFGISLLTICGLDWFIYGHLNNVRDEQLKQLAGQIHGNVDAELEDANQQLRTLTALALQCAATLPASEADSQEAGVKALRRIFTEEASTKLLEDCGEPPDQKVWPAKWDVTAIAEQRYPRFKTMALVDASGMQRFKWTSRVWQPAPIDVAGRAYFRNAKAGRLWHRDSSSADAKSQSCGSNYSLDADSSYTLESIWSWTTAEPEAVMAIRTCDEKHPVAALTISMTSLIDPVLPAGMEFAVIAEDGAVLFHSDPQRNTHENLFEESDQNRRLRAAVNAHIAEYVDLNYAGRSYRSWVQRLGAGTPWTIVTLSNKEPMWGLHTEWLALTLVALVLFLSFLAAVLALCFLTWHADWLWADYRQVRRYVSLSFSVLLLLLVAVGALAYLGNRAVVIVSVALPLAAWGISYLTVRRSVADDGGERDAFAEWRVLAVLLFLLTGVVPAAGLLTAISRVAIRADVKHVQLEVARALTSHEQRLSDIGSGYPQVQAAPKEKLEERYDYYLKGSSSDRVQQPGANDLPTFYFATTQPEPPQPDRASGIFDVFDEIAEIIAEEYLPYYSERAVQIRELLLHERADDDAWWWDQDRLTFRRSQGQPAIVVAAGVPRLFDGLRNEAFPVPGLVMVLGGLGLFALVVGVVWFIEVHVCLRGVNEPLWAKGRTGSSGHNLFVICRPDQRNELTHDCFDLRTQSQDWSISDEELMGKLLEKDRATPGCPVLLDDFDERLGDPTLEARRLAWIEQLAADDTRTLIVLSPDGPNLVDQTLRARVRTTTADAQLLERRRAVFAAFIVIDWRTKAAGGRESRPRSRFRERWRDSPPLTVEGVRGFIDERNHHVALEALNAEARADAFVRAVCLSIENSVGARPLDSASVGNVGPASGGSTVTAVAVPVAPAPHLAGAVPVVATVAVLPGSSSTQPMIRGLRLSPDQVLDEIADRTDAWYRRIWRSCTSNEQLVLSEIASEGFVNYKSRRTVRRLLGRRLIAKDPGFRLMNETFRRFVLSPPCQADIQTIEGASEPSPWDRLRVPFFTMLTAFSLFLLLTQRELFNATVATLSTLTVAVPATTRFLALVGGKQPAAESKA